MIRADEDKFRVGYIKLLAETPLFSKSLYSYVLRIRGRILLRGEECNNPHEPVNFWSRKTPLDQFGVGQSDLKIKSTR